MIIVKPELVLPQFVGTEFKNEWVENFSSQAYHADHAAVSSSGFVEDFILTSPMQYHWRAQGNRRKSTPALEFGSLVHMAILEPDEFKKTYIALPPTLSRNGALATARMDKWLKENEDKIVIGDKEMDALLGILHRVGSEPWVQKLLAGAVKEVSGWFRDPTTGLKCRIRPDVMNRLPNGKKILLDVKTTRDASYKGFFREIDTYGYDIRMSMYEQGITAIDGSPPDSVVVVAVEKEAPFHHAIYELDAGIMSTGKHLYELNMRRLANCIRTNVWPGYQRKPETMFAPKWYQDQAQQRIEKLESELKLN